MKTTRRLFGAMALGTALAAGAALPQGAHAQETPDA